MIMVQNGPINNKPALAPVMVWSQTGHKPLLESTGISLGMQPANERRRYNVMTSLIGWTHT